MLLAGRPMASSLLLEHWAATAGSSSHSQPSIYKLHSANANHHSCCGQMQNAEGTCGMHAYAQVGCAVLGDAQLPVAHWCITAGPPQGNTSTYTACIQLHTLTVSHLQPCELIVAFGMCVVKLCISNPFLLTSHTLPNLSSSRFKMGPF